MFLGKIDMEWNSQAYEQQERSQCFQTCLIMKIALRAVELFCFERSGERTYYGPNTNILRVRERVVTSQDFAPPEHSVIAKATVGVVQADPAWDEDSCEPDRPIAGLSAPATRTSNWKNLRTGVCRCRLQGQGVPAPSVPERGEVSGLRTETRQDLRKQSPR